MPTIDEMLAEGRRCQRAGDAGGAEQAFRRILEVEPGHVQALYMLGACLHVQGRLPEAVEQYQKALRIDEARGEVHNNLGIALAMLGRMDEAAAAFRRVVVMKPGLPDAHNNLGNALRTQGRLEEAVGCFHEALRLRPNYAEAHHNLGVTCLGQFLPDRAIECFEATLRVKPDYAEALEGLRQASEMKLHVPGTLLNRGNWLVNAGKLEDAVGAYREALRLLPDFDAAHNNLGNALLTQNKIDEAVGEFEHALALNPDLADAHNNLGNARIEQGRVDEAIECYRRACAFTPGNATFHDGLLVAINYARGYDGQALMEEQRRWEAAHALPLSSFNHGFENDRSPDRRLRIGYVSPDFIDHAVGRNIWPLLSNHDHECFEVTLYMNRMRQDWLTGRFRECADRWRLVAGWADERIAERVREDRIDILVDLALHTMGNRLLVFARKPAPVQVTFAGNPAGTGMSAIDYRLTDPYLDPPGMNDRFYAEESYRLPHTFWCYDPQGETPAVSALRAPERGFVTFSCLNNTCKINEGVLAMWSKVLHAVKGSKLMLLAKEGSHRQWVLDLLTKHGIAGERIEFCSFRPRMDYLRSYQHADIGLDTVPYNGHTTSLDSFWMGVPVVTLVGNRVVGRAGLSQLTNLGLSELAADTEERFVEIAVALARDPERLGTLRAGLRERMRESPLMDAEGFARGIEQAYRVMWRKWCEGTPKPASG